MTISRISLFALILSHGALASAQQAAEPPKVTVLHPGVNRLMEDLDYLVVKLGNNGQTWNAKLLPNLEVFFPGVDLNRPMRIDVILDPNAKAEQYRSSFPVDRKDLVPNFLNRNIKPLGINYIQVQRDFYKLSGAYTGFMRFEEPKPKAGYATFAEVDKQLPKGYDPLAGVPLEEFADKDWIVGFESDPNDQKAMADRAKGMQTLRNNLLAGIVKKKDESDATFNLRRLTAEHQLVEQERFFVESQKLSASWNTDTKSAVGDGKLQLSAIPKTPLAKSFESQASKPSRFAVMAIDPMISSAFRVNFSLDEMRIKHLGEFYDALRVPMAEKIPSVERWDEDQRKTANDLGNQFLDMLKDCLSLGVVDGFYDAQLVGNVHEVIGGFMVSKPELLKQMVADYPKLEKNAEVTMSTEEISGVEIHKVEVKAQISPAFASLFGPTAVVYIGTGKDTVWFSVGANTLGRLKDAIKSVSEAVPGQADGRMLHYHARLLPVVRAIQAQVKNKERENFRLQLIAGLESGDDSVEIRLEQKAGEIFGFAQVRAGLLAAIGKVIAEFANTNL